VYHKFNFTDRQPDEAIGGSEYGFGPAYYTGHDLKTGYQLPCALSESSYPVGSDPENPEWVTDYPVRVQGGGEPENWTYAAWLALPKCGVDSKSTRWGGTPTSATEGIGNTRGSRAAGYEKPTGGGSSLWVEIFKAYEGSGTSASQGPSCERLNLTVTVEDN